MTCKACNEDTCIRVDVEGNGICETCCPLHEYGDDGTCISCGHVDEHLEKMAKHLEASGAYRVLRRLPDLPSAVMPYGDNVRRGLYVDCEATGTDTAKDEIIELCVRPFQFTTDGLRISAERPVRWYNEPKGEISQMITDLTGITADMVRGKAIDLDHLGAMVDVADIVIAHNAEYDRQMLERYLGKFANKCWACSMAQVPWPGRSKRLEHLVASMGYFYDAHGALEDTKAGLFALTRDVNGVPGLAHLLANARKTTAHCWALRAHYDYKDALKARGYHWNGGEDGRPKAWHKEVDDEAAEREWLAANVYKMLTSSVPARFDQVTPYNRFSRRA